MRDRRVRCRPIFSNVQRRAEKAHKTMCHLRWKNALPSKKIPRVQTRGMPTRISYYAVGASHSDLLRMRIRVSGKIVELNRGALDGKVSINRGKLRFLYPSESLRIYMPKRLQPGDRVRFWQPYIVLGFGDVRTICLDSVCFHPGAFFSTVDQDAVIWLLLFCKRSVMLHRRKHSFFQEAMGRGQWKNLMTNRRKTVHLCLTLCWKW